VAPAGRRRFYGAIRQRKPPAERRRHKTGTREQRREFIMIPPISGSPQTFTSGNESSAAAPAETSSGSDFLSELHSAVDQVNQLQSDASTKVSSMLSGDGQDIHSTMIAVQKADLAFELMVEMRNKIVSAYQEISRIPF
jgi:flagellar hook-basal body complex protein FliE